MFVIAEFGSVYRRSDDSFSDKDLLIVCEKEYVKYYYAKYTRRGYSVSVFSEKQLLSMRNKGSLFLQHLKLESRLLVDVGAEFKSFIKECELVSPGDDELYSCKKTIENLYVWPNNLISLGWKADFLYGSSRDYLIKFLAKNGVIAFGLESIIEEVSLLLSVPISKFNDLRELRKIKSTYRSGSVLPQGEYIECAINGWYELLNNTFGLKLSDLDYSEIIINKFFTSGYERLRYLEILYMSLVKHGYYHENHKEIVNFILKPNLYQSLRYSKLKIIEGYLCEIYEIYKTAKINYNIKPLQSTVLLCNSP
ncbi:hypothetical protein [Pectobacterium versatile]|uniref:hypothetical protein n=1 Tax=Pectobacterium versatile TaxID=2488639 RepID=UPI001F2B9898|nr:hypothetical protein [Pectobacterium versatile]